MTARLSQPPNELQKGPPAHDDHHSDDHCDDFVSSGLRDQVNHPFHAGNAAGVSSAVSMHAKFRRFGTRSLF